MTQARREKMNPLAIETHHIWSRCVRGAFLLGVDPVTGEDVSHRRAMLESIIEYQASVFAVDWGTDHCLINHLHGTGRNRPDIAKRWSDEEVAWRWKQAWPTYSVRLGWHREPTDQEIRELLLRGDREEGFLQRLRSNLSNLSWFIARIKQPIAYFANRDHPDPKYHCRGHFWDGRYGNRKLGTFGEVLGSFLYNDLQQIRAGVVDCLEDSNFSAIQKQLRAFASQAFGDMHERAPTDDDDDHAELERLEKLFGNCYLSPLDANAPLMTEADPNPPASELVLPIGYYHQPVRLNWDYAQAIPADAVEADAAPEGRTTAEDTAPEGRATAEDNDDVVTNETPKDANVGSAVEGSDANAADSQCDEPVDEDARGLPSRKASPRTIHNRLKLKQRRRASRSSILGLDAAEYLGLVQTVAQKMVEDRRCGQGTDSPSRVRRHPDAEDGTGAAPPMATPSTFHRSMSAFSAWLYSHVGEPIKRIIDANQELPRPPT